MDESRKRSIAKALSWQILGLAVTTVVTYRFTGTLGEAGALAALLTAIGLACYYVHERVWERLSWGTTHQKRRTAAHRPDGQARSVMPMSAARSDSGVPARVLRDAGE